jgi:hypothetical protein
MKHKVFIYLSLLLFVLILSACNREQPPIVGQWESEHTSLIFNADGSGQEIIDGQVFSFTWNEDEGILVFVFADNAEGSLINHFMSQVIHGEPVDEFGFHLSDDKQTLTITDDHGHGHFMLTFARVDT